MLVRDVVDVKTKEEAGKALEEMVKVVGENAKECQTPYS